jgi:hypothetical protein
VKEDVKLFLKRDFEAENEKGEEFYGLSEFEKIFKRENIERNNLV